MLRRTLRAFSGASGPTDYRSKTNAELVELVRDRTIPFYAIEEKLRPDFARAIEVRREFVKNYVAHLDIKPADVDEKKHALDQVPFLPYDWSRVVGSNCENIIGYVPIPVGLAGPIMMDGREYPIPMATTEGALVASTHRGARAINQSGGCKTVLLNEGMTRAPVIEVPDIETASNLKKYCDENFGTLKAAFDSTSRFGRLMSIKVAVAGRKVFVRFRALTGDAMGMNMVTKGVDKALELLAANFPSMKVLALSGNYCTDKKPSAINWVEGRGKSVVAEAVVRKDLVVSMLKCNVDDLIALNIDKNFVGSAMAGSLGGFNAQAANVVAAVFLATGQDPAQVVESAMCITMMSKSAEGDLIISVTMPSIEVGTVGGGTSLDAQHGVLQLIGCAGSNAEKPGANAALLARVIAAGVLSAELSLMSGLSAGHLLSAHMKLNRKPTQ